MSKASLIIIGAGLGGLATGIYAQMNGYQCRIFEHARHPGGVAAEWVTQILVPRLISPSSMCGRSASMHAHSMRPTMNAVANTGGMA